MRIFGGSVVSLFIVVCNFIRFRFKVYVVIGLRVSFVGLLLDCLCFELRWLRCLFFWCCGYAVDCMSQLS